MKWWDTRRQSYELCVSQLVRNEARAGDSQAAQERLDVLKTMTLLETSDEALDLAKELIRAGALPAKAADDALHIAVAAMNGIPYLLTWNCRHLANLHQRERIERVCRDHGYAPPMIGTPNELREDAP